MPSTPIYKRGQMVVVNVPFTGQTGAKPRPALVVSVEVFHRKLLDVMVCPISSQPHYYQRPALGTIRFRYPACRPMSSCPAKERRSTSAWWIAVDLIHALG